MRNQLVYDLPMRIFHWLFAGLFVFAFTIAETVDDDSVVFLYHMLAGLYLVFLVLLRVIWGFIGAKYSRFSSFALNPKELMSYFMGILTGDKTKWAGHNPASSWASLVMFALALGLGITGYLMANAQEETFEDIHELMANGFLIIVILHILGVILHSLRHRDGIGLAMIDGKKASVAESKPISNSYPVVALVFVALLAAFGFYLAKNFDGPARTLNLFGTTLQLGENEGGEDRGDGEGQESEHESEDGDDD